MLERHHFARGSTHTTSLPFQSFLSDYRRVDLGLTAFNFDSQKGVTGGQKGTEAITISDDEYVTIDAIFKQVGLSVN